jgi:hypothetical protein
VSSARWVIPATLAQMTSATLNVSRSHSRSASAASRTAAATW